MTGIEVVVGYLIAWAVRKSRRVGARLDKETDTVLDAGLDRLHSVVIEKLGNDPALHKLETEAQDTGEVAERTRQRVQLSIEEAAENDLSFSAALQQMVANLATASLAPTTVVAGGERSVAIAGGVEIQAESGSVAAVQMRDVSLGAQPDPRKPESTSG